MAEILVKGKTTPSVLTRPTEAKVEPKVEEVKEVPKKPARYIFLGMQSPGTFIVHDQETDTRMYVSRDWLLGRYQSGEITNLPPEVLQRIGAMPQIIPELPPIAEKPTAAFEAVATEKGPRILTKAFYKPPVEEFVEPEVARAIKFGATHIVQYPGGRTEYVKVEKPLEEMRYYIEEEGLKIPISPGVYEKIQAEGLELTTPEQYYKILEGKQIPISKEEYERLQKEQQIIKEQFTEIEKRRLEPGFQTVWGIEKIFTLEAPMAAIGAIPAYIGGRGEEYWESLKEKWESEQRGIIYKLGMGERGEVFVERGVPMVLAGAMYLAPFWLPKVVSKIPLISKIPPKVGAGIITGVSAGILTYGLTEAGEALPKALKGEAEAGIKFGKGIFMAGVGALGVRAGWKRIFPPKPKEEVRILKPEEKEYVPEYGTEEKKTVAITKPKHFEKPVVEKTLSEERIYGKPTKEPIELKPYDTVVQKTTSKFARGIRQVGRETYLVTEKGVFKLEQPFDIERFISLGEKRPTILGLKPSEFAEYGEGIFFGKVKKLTIAPEQWLKEIISGREALPKTEVFTRMIGVERPEEFAPLVMKGEPSGIFAWDVAKAPVTEPSLGEFLGIKDITHVGKFYLEPTTGKIITEATILGEKLIPTPIGYTTVVTSPAVTETIVYPPGVPSPTPVTLTSIGILQPERVEPAILKLPDQAHFSKIGTITEKEQKRVMKIKSEVEEAELSLLGLKVEPITKVSPETKLEEQLATETRQRVLPIGTVIQESVLGQMEMQTQRQMLMTRALLAQKVVGIPRPILKEFPVKKRKVELIEEWLPRGFKMPKPPRRKEKRLLEDIMYYERLHKLLPPEKLLGGEKKRAKKLKRELWWE